MLHRLYGSSPKVWARQNGCTHEQPSESKNGAPCGYMHAMAVTSLQDCKLGQGLSLLLALMDKFALTDHTEMDTFLSNAPSHYHHISYFSTDSSIFVLWWCLMKRSWLGPYSNAVKSAVVFYESKENPARALVQQILNKRWCKFSFWVVMVGCPHKCEWPCVCVSYLLN